MYKIKAIKDEYTVYFIPTIHMNVKKIDYGIKYFDKRIPIYTEIGRFSSVNIPNNPSNKHPVLVDAHKYENVNVEDLFPELADPEIETGFESYLDTINNTQYPLVTLFNVIFYLFRQNSNLDPKYGTERVIDEHFKQIIALETMKFQLEIFEYFQGNFIGDVLYKKIKDVLSMKNNTDPTIIIVNAYNKSLPLDEIEKLMVKGNEMYDPKVYKITIVDRNLSMFNTFISKIYDNKHTTSILAVGSGHYGGPKGIISLFKQNGWKIKNY